MNATSPHQVFLDLQRIDLPSPAELVRIITLSALKGIHQLLLLYPINLLLCLLVLLWISHALVSRFTSTNKIQYATKTHIERFDQRVKRLKKDMREIQTQSSNLHRKMQQSEQQRQPEAPHQNSQNLKVLLQERPFLEEVSKDLMASIKQSRDKIIEKLSRHKR